MITTPIVWPCVCHDHSQVLYGLDSTIGPQPTYVSANWLFTLTFSRRFASTSSKLSMAPILMSTLASNLAPIASAPSESLYLCKPKTGSAVCTVLATETWKEGANLQAPLNARGPLSCQIDSESMCR